MATKSLRYLLQNDQLPDIAINQLTLDSRLVKPGGLFFAYPGFSQDGRDYIEQALANGAAAVIYDDADHFKYNTSAPAPVIPLSNLQAKVSAIAARLYDDPSSTLNIIGVTGTNGKTSITHFIAQAFALQGIECGMIGTIGWGCLNQLNQSAHTTPNPIQLQQQLATFKQDSITTVAMEVSSHALDQGRLNAVAFTTAVYTQLSRDHLDYHGDIESYARAKEKLLQIPGLQQAVINADDVWGSAWIKKYSPTLKVVSYGLKPEVKQYQQFIYAQKITPIAFGYQVGIDSSWGQGELIVPMLGEFNISNVLAVLGVLLVNDLPLQQALAHCSQLKSVKGRMQTFGNALQPKVVVDYAHTPDALEKTLGALRMHCQGKLWCVFGCGGDRDQGKRPLMGAVAAKLADYVVITDDNPRSEPSQTIADEIKAGIQMSARVKTILNRAEAIQSVVQSAKINDIVLIAGKGHETSQVVGEQTFAFDDAEHVVKALAQRI